MINVPFWDLKLHLFNDLLLRIIEYVVFSLGSTSASYTWRGVSPENIKQEFYMYSIFKKLTRVVNDNVHACCRQGVIYLKLGWILCHGWIPNKVPYTKNKKREMYFLCMQLFVKLWGLNLIPPRFWLKGVKNFSPSWQNPLQATPLFVPFKKSE